MSIVTVVLEEQERVRAAGIATEEYERGFLVRDPWEITVLFVIPKAPGREKRIRLNSRPGVTLSSFGWRCGRVSTLAFLEAVGAPSKNLSEKCEMALTLTLREALGYSV